MPTCSFCGNFYFKTNALITHLKIIHQCQESSTYSCGEKNCRRNFPSLKSFRKHLNNHSLAPAIHRELLKRNDSVNCQTTLGIGDISDDLCQQNLTIKSHYSNLENEKQKSRQELYSSVLIQNEKINFTTFKNKLNEKIIVFMCGIYSENTFSRKDVQKIMNLINELLSEPLDIFNKFIDHVYNESNIPAEDVFEMNRFFQELKILFEDFGTEHLRFKILERADLFIKPVEFTVGEYIETKNNVPVVKKYTAHFISLSQVLRNFFSIPGILFETMTYLEQLQNLDNVYNIIQTNFWREKISDFKKTDIVLPLFIYYDDYETGNPLGSRAGIHKLGAIYSTVACLPPKYQSRLENIFLVTLFHSTDLKEFGDKVIFSKLVDELNYLRNTGIFLKIQSNEYRLHFCTVSFLGDNLALNTILGFQESFSSNSYCRFCKLLRVDAQNSTLENVQYLRTPENYKDDIITNYPYLTGVKQNSILNKIKSFHVTENFCIDIAHDIFEGVAVVVLAHLLNKFIFEEKFFDLQTLNNRLKHFNFSANHNKPPLIMHENLKKMNLRMSASEMKTFLLNADLIFGDLIPEGNKYWKLYILLRKIVCVILKDFFTPETENDLRNLIHDHHSLFISLFAKPLKPKFHFMTHYPSILLNSGPLKNMSTLRYESKHRQFKLSANVIASRVNISYSLAVKHQLQLASKFVNQRGFSHNTSYSTIIKEYSNIDSLPKFSDILKNSSGINHEKLCSFDSRIVSCNKITVNSKIYRVNDIICVDYENKNHFFGKISNIIINEFNDILFVYKYIVSITFNEHLFSYVVDITELEKCVFFNFLKIFDTFVIIKRNEINYLSV
ncbi:uncharacterized protein LOC108915902 isoform X2 [Anoplophora glabripennis]|uniref:uncharacterized protein LOC108915902 isoform X2 n=1 Tax=Anoplophora glabripennis TaxID=217634 RepID=UPI000C77E3E2|nr:uncharacterized protein LOC108915902 isoform X2 [Anoplophora glabripennis]